MKEKQIENTYYSVKEIGYKIYYITYKSNFVCFIEENTAIKAYGHSICVLKDNMWSCYYNGIAQGRFDKMEIGFFIKKRRHRTRIFYFDPNSNLKSFDAINWEFYIDNYVAFNINDKQTRLYKILCGDHNYLRPVELQPNKVLILKKKDFGCSSHCAFWGNKDFKICNLGGKISLKMAWCEANDIPYYKGFINKIKHFKIELKFLRYLMSK